MVGHLWPIQVCCTATHADHLVFYSQKVKKKKKMKRAISWCSSACTSLFSLSPYQLASSSCSSFIIISIAKFKINDDDMRKHSALFTLNSVGKALQWPQLHALETSTPSISPFCLPIWLVDLPSVELLHRSSSTVTIQLWKISQAIHESLKIQEN